MTEPVNEADLLEQQVDVVPAEGEQTQVVPTEVEPGEADPADVREQQLPVPADEDEAPDGE